jgi:hypothetical protein
MKMDIDRHGPRPMPNSCKNLNPPNFSLPSTFNGTLIGNGNFLSFQFSIFFKSNFYTNLIAVEVPNNS